MQFALVTLVAECICILFFGQYMAENWQGPQWWMVFYGVLVTDFLFGMLTGFATNSVIQYFERKKADTRIYVQTPVFKYVFSFAIVAVITGAICTRPAVEVPESFRLVLRFFSPEHPTSPFDDGHASPLKLAEEPKPLRQSR